MCDTKACIKYSPSLEGCCMNECTGAFMDTHGRKCPKCGSWKERRVVDETAEEYPFVQWSLECPRGCK